MKRNFPYTTLSMILLLTFVGTVTPVDAVTVNTKPASDEMRGKSIQLELKVGSGGVGSEPKTPLGRVEGTVGDRIDLGELSSIPDQPVELRVILSSGSYYRSVSKEALQNGTINLTVYPYDSEQSYSILEHGILMQPFPNRIMVREYLVVQNPSMNTLAGGQRNPLTFDLPQNTGEIHAGPGLSGGQDLTKQGQYHNYELMFPPGRTVLGFYYMVRTQSDPYSYEREVTVPTQSLVLSLPSYGNLDVRTEGLREAKMDSKKKGPERVQYVGQNLNAGDVVSVTLDGLSDVKPMGKTKKGSQRPSGRTGQEPETGQDLTSLSSVSWPLVLGIGLSAAIFFGAYGYVQYRLANAPTDGIDPSFLVEEIARLDQEFEDGAIDEPFYKRTRRRWKNVASRATDDESADG